MKRTILYLVIIILNSTCVGREQINDKNVFSNGKYEFIFFDKIKYDSVKITFKECDKSSYNNIIEDLKRMKTDLLKVSINKDDEYIRYISQFETNYESFSSLDSLEKTSIILLLDSTIKILRKEIN